SKAERDSDRSSCCSICSSISTANNNCQIKRPPGPGHLEQDSFLEHSSGNGVELDCGSSGDDSNGDMVCRGCAELREVVIVRHASTAGSVDISPPSLSPSPSPGVQTRYGSIHGLAVGGLSSSNSTSGSCSSRFDYSSNYCHHGCTNRNSSRSSSSRSSSSRSNSTNNNLSS
ncbi:hypothetical protein Vretifemale_7595, partial [Volvox reticuliferus]